MTNQSTQNYIPGFDWVKLIGSTVVVFHHLYFDSLIRQFININWISMGNYFITLFFAISGYLMIGSMKKHRDYKKAVCQYCLKYIIIYYAVQLIPIILHYVSIYKETGIIMYKDFIYVQLSLLLGTHYSRLYQLWFMMPLVFGILVNAWIFGEKKEKKIFPWLIGTVIGYVVIKNAASVFDISFIKGCLNRSVLGTTVNGVISSFYLNGFAVVFIGMWFRKYEEQITFASLRKWMPVAILLTMVELVAPFLHPALDNAGLLYIGIYYWIILAFYGILRLKGRCLYPWHKYITIFSGLNYFLHVSENTFLRHCGIENSILRFLMIILFNMILTVLLCRKKRV